MQPKPHEGYYLIYLRKSRADLEKERAGKFETLAIHEQQLTEFAQKNGYPVAEIYRELVSGESIKERLEFQKVMKRIEDPECKGVICHAIDRLGRGDPMEYGWILSTFKFTKTSIITPGRAFDPSNPDDIQTLKLHMFVANVEYDHIRERMRAGSVASAKRGSYLGSSPPYGYERAVIDNTPSLIPNESEAPIAKRIFKMAASGMNKGAIARALNSDGIPTKKGFLWTAARIGVMLENPIYKGYVRYGYTTQHVLGTDGRHIMKRTRRSPEGEYILAKGVHEPLVSEEIWKEARLKAFEGVPVKRDRTIKNPLAGLIVCGKCKRALVRQVAESKSGKKTPRLHHAYHTECQCRSIALEPVMESLVDALLEIASNIEAGVLRCGVDPSEIEALEHQISREEGRLDKLIELYNAEAITVEEFKERRASSAEKKERMHEALAKLQAKHIDEKELLVSTRDAIAKLKDDSVPAEDKNAVLKAFIERIDYYELNQAWKYREFELHVKLRGME